MLNEHAQAWVAALRSGNYQQSRGALRKDDTFCCLGVACDLIEPESWEFSKIHHGYPEKGYTHNGRSDFLPAPIAAALQINGADNLQNDGFVQFTGSFRATPELLAKISNEAKYAIHQTANDERCSLSSLNDWGATFEVIAEIIAAEPPHLFITLNDTPGE